MDKTTDKIIELLTDYYEKDYTIFNGDPVFIPTSMLPALIVVKTGGSTEDGPTGADAVTEDISIRAVYNMNEYMGGSMTENIPHNKIVDMFEARTATGEYEASAIMGILRRNYTLGNSIVGQKFTVQYELLLENRTTKAGTVTLEGHLNFSTRQLVAVPVRI